jgi:DNA sulfur modification protein DndC
MEKITALPEWAHLRPLLEFRQRVKDVTRLIESRVLRPDGKPGRLSLETRRKLLDELLSLQSSIKMKLISEEEVALIQKLWEDERFKEHA